jgi:GntR family transcriptional regulator, galactonate operon transcriptional repressor
MKRRTKGSIARGVSPGAANGWQRKADSVLDQLGQKVVSGRYGAGRRLPTEAELARKLNISRPSLREGLQALARKGLVDSRPRRGTTVLDKERWDIFDPDVLRWMASAAPDPAFMIALLEARKILEPAAARLAAMRASATQILAIDRAFQGMADSLPHDVEACCQHDLVFHESIFAAAGNPLLHRFVLAIRSGLLASFRISADARESYESSLVEHRAVAIAIRKREPDKAEQAMHTLLAGTSRDLAPTFEARPSVKGIKPNKEATHARTRREVAQQQTSVQPTRKQPRVGK